MNMLTARNDKGGAYYVKCYERCNGDPDPEDCYSCEMVLEECEALAAYEDTGLDPAQVKAVARFVNYRRRKLEEDCMEILRLSNILNTEKSNDMP